MFDPQRLLSSLLHSQVSSPARTLNRLAFGTGMTSGKLGALALLGGVAAGAFEHFSQQRQSMPGAGAPQPPPGSSGSPSRPPPPPPGTSIPAPPPVVANGTQTTPPTPPPIIATPPPPPSAAISAAPPPPPDAKGNETATLLIRAMIGAAKADGVIDATERQRILERLQDASPEDRAFVEAEMQKPLNPDEWLVDIPADPNLAAQIYTASLLAIELDTSTEVKYFKMLARRLSLDEPAVNRIHDQYWA
ncbi:MAG: DUF533 domain-containing protein [Candidatus Competibacteraceae bacterium]